MAEEGRPTKYRVAFIRQAIRLGRLGATDREVADFFQVSESTLYLWKSEHPKFSEALKAGKEHADARVQQSLYRRALGYSHDAVKIFNDKDNGTTQVPYVEHYPPDTTACIFWLKNRQPEAWRDKFDLDTMGITRDRAARLLELVERRLDALESASEPPSEDARQPGKVN
jgi:hypothetical protein